MKITLAAVCSLDGKITRGNEHDITQWASPEDLVHFKSLIGSHEVVVMGRITYEVNRHAIKQNLVKRRIILTSNPKKFKHDAVIGTYEFTKESPAELTKRLEAESITTVLVVGGGVINAAFLAADLVDEIYLTIEPLVFGAGTSLATTKPLYVNFRLLSCKRLNAQGSLLLHYARS